MKVAAAVVISVDGKMTRHGDPDVHSWASEEDTVHFRELRDQYSSLVMGSNTYEVLGPFLKLSPDHLRVVLTHKPEKYAAKTVEDQLEFRTLTPAEVVSDLESRGYKDLLIVGGGRMITDFLKAGLVNELYITIEPWLFGTGLPLIAEDLDVQLELIEVHQANDRGTLIITYNVTET